MTQQPEKKTDKKNILETIADSAGIGNGKKDKKNVFAKTKTRLSPESLEAREMMTGNNPLEGDWFASNDFVKYDLSESRASALASVLEDAGDLSEGGVVDVPNEWLIQLSNNLANQTGDVAGATRYFQSMGITVVEGLGSVGALHVVVNGGTAADQRLKLSSIVGITGFEPNQMLVSAATKVQDVVNDASASALWNLNVGQVADAWNYVPENTAGTGEVIVAVLDSGVNINHADLKDNIWVNTKELKGTTGVDDDANGFKDDVYGWNFYDNNNNVLDNNGHGTHVAGTIAAAANNSIGVTGVAPNAKILPLKFLNSSGNGFSSDATRAVNYTTALKLAGNNIVAINCSFGSTTPSSTLATAIVNAGNAGIVVVAAAGNESYNLDVTRVYPATVVASNLITVGATTSSDSLAYYSNYGSYVDVAAPGSDIYSTTMGGGYGYMSGTSMAAPFVSGMVALVAATNPKLTPTQIKAAIVGGVDVLPQLAGKVSSSGRVNAANTLAAVSGNPPRVNIPTSPNGLTAGTWKANQIDISWNSAGYATSYTLEVQAVGSNTWTTIYTGSDTKFSHTGLKAEAQYTYRVSAANSAGTSAASTTVTATVSATTTSTRVDASTFVVTPDASSFVIAWEAIPGATSYMIQRSLDSGKTWSYLESTNTASQTFKGASDSSDYYYRMAAVIGGVTQEYSDPVLARSAGGVKLRGELPTSEVATPIAAPVTPGGLAATTQSSSQINVAWNAVSGATSYKLEVQTAGSNTWTTVYTGSATSFANTGLAASTQYTYRVSAVNSGGTSAVSSTIAATTKAAAPSTPTGLSSNTATASTIGLTWNSVTGATSYVLEIQISGKWTTIYTGSSTSFTSTGLSNNTSYSYRISAVNAIGTSEVSSTFSTKTKNK